MIILGIIIACLLMVYNKMYSVRTPITSYILPFSYQMSENVMAGCDVLNIFLSQYPNRKVKRKLNDIMNIKRLFRPTWGVKIGKEKSNGSRDIEYEIYSYNYTPVERQINKKDTFSLEEMTKILNMKGQEITSDYVMFSYDLHSDESPNLYYVSYSTLDEDYGISTKNGEMQNKYYRYTTDNISQKWRNYFIEEYLPLEYNDIKVVFIADKLQRNFIGVYYDGVHYEIVEDMLRNFGVEIKGLEKHKKKRFSISMDVCKVTKEIVRVGVYGILY